MIIHLIYLITRVFFKFRRFLIKLKPTLNKQKESELFTLIIRNVKMKNSIIRDIQKLGKVDRLN